MNAKDFQQIVIGDKLILLEGCKLNLIPTLDQITLDRNQIVEVLNIGNDHLTIGIWNLSYNRYQLPISDENAQFVNHYMPIIFSNLKHAEQIVITSGCWLKLPDETSMCLASNTEFFVQEIFPTHIVIWNEAYGNVVLLSKYRYHIQISKGEKDV